MSGTRRPLDTPAIAAGYLSLRALSVYAGLSVRTLRPYLTDPSRPLPHYRIGGKILVRKADYDAWASAFRVSEPAGLGDVVNEVMAGLR